MIRHLPHALLTAALLIPFPLAAFAQDHLAPEPPVPAQPGEPDRPSATALAERLTAADDDATQRALLEVIGQLGPRAVPAVAAVSAIAANPDADIELRLDALQTLHDIGRPANSAATTLLRLTGNPELDARLRESASAVLERIAATGVEKLTMDQARNRIWAHILEVRPGMNPQVKADLKLDDITTDELWVRLGAQIVVNTDTFLWNATFLFYRGEMVPVGPIDWGGAGSLALTDIDGDGMAELFFSWSIGSGILRSSVAALGFDDATVRHLAIPSPHTVNAPISVRRMGERVAVVPGHSLKQWTRPDSPGRELGRYSGTRTDGKLTVEFTVDPDIPEAFRRFVPRPEQGEGNTGENGEGETGRDD